MAEVDMRHWSGLDETTLHGDASDPPRSAPAAALIDVGRAIDHVLREAGGGRFAAVRIAREHGGMAYLVQFVHGSRLCAATVDAFSGEVTANVDHGTLPSAEPAGLRMPTARQSQGDDERVELTLASAPLQDVTAAFDDPSVAYVATQTGVAVVALRLERRRELLLETQHATGYGVTRHVVAVPSGVVGVTADGRVFRLDRNGGVRWETRLAAAPSTVAANPAGTRLLIATNAGDIQVDAGSGEILRVCRGSGMPVRTAAYLPNGDRILAGHSGTLQVFGDDGTLRWSWKQGERPERLWTQGDRVYLSGEGGLKEIVVRKGVVCRWSSPSPDAVESAVVADGQVFACVPGRHVSRYGYATADYRGRLADTPTPPAAITLVNTRGADPWLLVAHRDGLLAAWPADRPDR
jgi:hypothetical protein